MKVQKINRLLLPAFILSVIFSLASCSNSDNSVNHNDFTGFLSFGFSEDTVADYVFDVDNQENVIQNKDSLPYQFDVSNLKAQFELVDGSVAKVNGALQESGVTANDFTNTVIYTLIAGDGVTSKSYEVKVNVAQLDPEGLNWKRTTTKAFDADYDTQEYFYLNGKHFVVLGKKNKSEFEVYSSEDGSTWKEEEVSGDLPKGFSHNIVVQDGTAYVVGFLEMADPFGLGDPQFFQPEASEDLYTTQDGVTWSKTEGALEGGGRINTVAYTLDNTLYAVGGNTSVFGSFQGSKPAGSVFYPPAGVDGTTLISTGGTSFSVSDDYTGDMPRRIQAASYVYDGKMYLAGGLGTEGEPLSDVWSSSDGVNWTQVSDGAFDARFKASTIVYDNKVWMVGGVLADGHTTAEILVSEDGGQNWMPADDAVQFPNDFTPRCNAMLSVDEEENLWVIGGEDTEVSTNDDGDITIEYKQLTDAWKGKLNKLEE